MTWADLGARPNSHCAILSEPHYVPAHAPTEPCRASRHLVTRLTVRALL
jgi:hypothetical protein